MTTFEEWDIVQQQKLNKAILTIYLPPTPTSDERIQI